jgi:hypothetical protein
MAVATGVRWAGEFHTLDALGEKEAFVSQLTALGYRPELFRVTVRRIPSGGIQDTRVRYNVYVDELKNGQPYRGKPYLGGHGQEWVKQFASGASTDFPKL